MTRSCFSTNQIWFHWFWILKRTFILITKIKTCKSFFKNGSSGRDLNVSFQSVVFLTITLAVWFLKIFWWAGIQWMWMMTFKIWILLIIYIRMYWSNWWSNFRTARMMIWLFIKMMIDLFCELFLMMFKMMFIFINFPQ